MIMIQTVGVCQLNESRIFLSKKNGWSNNALNNWKDRILSGHYLVNGMKKFKFAGLFVYATFPR